MKDEKIEQKFKELGFTSYEAKAYLALLRQNPVTRYELSKNSGVPRSAIYDIIRKLENMGAVNAMYTKPEKYVPLPPEQLLELLGRQFSERIEEAKQSLEKFNTEIEPGICGILWAIKI
jgi:sugar-specific transcriptional regulator TrmB